MKAWPGAPPTCRAAAPPIGPPRSSRSSWGCQHQPGFRRRPASCGQFAGYLARTQVAIPTLRTGVPLEIHPLKRALLSPKWLLTNASVNERVSSPRRRSPSFARRAERHMPRLAPPHRPNIATGSRRRHHGHVPHTSDPPRDPLSPSTARDRRTPGVKAATSLQEDRAPRETPPQEKRGCRERE